MVRRNIVGLSNLGCMLTKVNLTQILKMNISQLSSMHVDSAESRLQAFQIVPLKRAGDDVMCDVMGSPAEEVARLCSNIFHAEEDNRCSVLLFRLTE